MLSVGIAAALAAFALLMAGLDKNSHGADASGAIGAQAPASLISGGTRDSARVAAFKSLLYLCGLCVGVSLGVPVWGYVFLFVGCWAAGVVLVTQHPAALLVVAALWSLGSYAMLQRTGLAELEWGVRQSQSPSQSQMEAAHASPGYIHDSPANMLWILSALAIIVPTAHVALEHATLALRGGSGLEFLGSSLGLPSRLFSGAAISRFLRGLVGAQTCLYVFVLGSLEWDWARMDAQGLFDSKVYAWYMVLATSGLGLGLAWKLSPAQTGRIGRRTYIALLTLNIWKLSVLFVDDRRDLWHALAFVAVQVPLWVSSHNDDQDHEDHGHHAQDATSLNGGRSASKAHGGRMSRTWVVLHVVSVLGVMWLCKNTVLAHLLHMSGLHTLLSSSSSSSALPTESSFVGWWGVCSALGLLPLSFGRGLSRDPRSPEYRRTNILGLLVAATFFVTQPRLDFLGGAASFDPNSDVFERAMDTNQPRWPPWILFATLTTILLCVSSVATQASSSSSSSSPAGAGAGLLGWVPRPVLALGLGCSMGLYALGTTLPPQLTLYALFLAAFNAATFFVVYLFVKPAPAAKGAAAAGMGGVVGSSGEGAGGGGMFGFLFRSKFSRSGSGPSSVLTLAYCALVALLPVTYVAIGLVYSSSGPQGRRGVSGAGAAAAAADVADVRALYRIALLSVHAALHFVVALVTNIQREMVSAAANNHSKEARFKNMQQYNSGLVGGGGASMVGGGGSGLRREGGAGGYNNADGSGGLCLLGNLSSILSFLLACVVAQGMLGGSVCTSTMLFAPLLLLLVRDVTTSWGRRIDSGNTTTGSGWGKWGPVVTGACAVLLWSAMLDLLPLLRPVLSSLGLASALSGAGAGVRAAGNAVGWWFRSKNLLLLAMCAPSLHSFMGFLWAWGRGGGSHHRATTTTSFRLLMLAPLNLLPLLCTDLSSVQLLVLIATLGICAQAYAMRASNRHGMRLI